MDNPMGLAELDPNAIDLEPVDSEIADEESAPAEYEITSYPADFTLELLWEKWKAKDLEIPAFQRQFVWKQSQSSKLIESFLLGLPVPPVFLYAERKSQKLLVVDGQQRLRTIFYFFEGFFGNDHAERRPVFRLKGLNEESRWRDKAFADLDEADQRKLKNVVLRAILIQQLDPEDDTSVFHVFERLNTGGTQLSGQEIRNCVYGGALRDLLIELNGLPKWRTIIGRAVPDRRGKDIELILRFLSLHDALPLYEKPLKDFMSKWMKRNRSPGADRLTELRSTFTNSCNAVVERLGERPFHIVRGLNAGVFDAVMVAFADNLSSIPQDIVQRFAGLKGDDSFMGMTRRATTDVSTVRGRVAAARNLLFGR